MFRLLVELYILCLLIYGHRDISLYYKEGHLIKLPKKVDLSNYNNYIDIMVLLVPGNVLNRILLDRIKAEVDSLLRDEQPGFRKGKSCADPTVTLRIILQQSIE